MANTPTLTFGLILVTGMSLAACGSKGEGEMPVTESRVDSGQVEDQFGEGFGKAFRADPYSEPANVSDNDVLPVSYTTEPVAIE